MKKPAVMALLLLCLGNLISATAQNTGSNNLPEKIQDGNILHCFDWPMATVTANLPSIAEAGFGAVQISPLQRKNVTSSTVWYDLYRPYDYAFQATSGMGSADDLKTLCAEAKKYGIKVIVDVVANHVDKTSGYHDSWWDSDSEYVRSKGGQANINYGSRQSITHDRLGDYYELNTENSEVIARAKAYIQQLHDMGVSGIRFDAAKHIELPSEGSQFWAEVTSVPDMFYYGEILGSTGGNSATLIAEYAKYMSVTDNEYSDAAAKSNGGVPTKALGNWANNSNVGASKVVLWGESHDTYSNTPEGGGWSTNISQAVINRAYAAMACRKGSAALYFARPNTAGFGNIKIGKGSDAYQGKAIKEVNKFRNKMGNTEESFSLTSNKDACSVTRSGKGAVIVAKTSGNVTVANGNGYLPAGTYTDRVSGVNQFVVTSGSIQGEVGPSGIVVLYDDPSEPIVEDDTDYSPEAMITVYYDNSLSKWTKVYIHYWGGNSETGWPGIQMKSGGNNIFVAEVPLGSNAVFNNGGNGLQSVNVNDLEDGHIYKCTTTSNNSPCTDEGIFEGEVEIDPDIYTIYYDNTYTQWPEVYCHYWGSSGTTWPGEEMTVVTGENNLYSISLPKGSSVVFNNNNKGKQSEDVTGIKHMHIYQIENATAAKAKANDIGVYTASAGIEDVFNNNDGNVNITWTSGTISLEGTPGVVVVVSDIMGRVQYSSTNFPGSIEITAQPGIYVVKAGATNKKILVK